MLFFLYGNNIQARNERLKQIKQAFRGKTQGAGEIFSFDAEEEFQQIKTALQNSSLFFEKRLLIIRNLFSKKDSALEEEIFERVKKRNIAGQKDVNIVFVEGKVLKSKSKLLKLLLKKPVLAEKFEIQSPDPKVKIFEVLDALAARNPRRSLPLLQEILQYESPLVVLKMTSWQFRNLLKVKTFLEKRVHPQVVAAALKINPFVAKKAVAACQNFKYEELKQKYRELLDMDMKIKKGADAESLLFRFFMS